ncbi:MAG: hypothetical protein RIQ59_1603 [Bacteroidota bacterium]|jgi:hypothetical protein
MFLKKILPLFSYLFHPIFIPIFGTLFYYYLSRINNSKELFSILIIEVAIFTFILPLSFFYLLRSIGKVDTIMLSDISQRKIPLLFQILLLVILISKYVTWNLYPALFFFFLGAILSAFLAYILLFAKIKASIHLMAISALCYFVIGLNSHFELQNKLIIFLLFVLTGIIASSRIAMKAHSMKELAIGYVVGMLPQIILWGFWL